MFTNITQNTNYIAQYEIAALGTIVIEQAKYQTSDTHTASSGRGNIRGFCSKAFTGAKPIKVKENSSYVDISKCTFTYEDPSFFKVNTDGTLEIYKTGEVKFGVTIRGLSTGNVFTMNIGVGTILLYINGSRFDNLQTKVPTWNSWTRDYWYVSSPSTKEFKLSAKVALIDSTIYETIPSSCIYDIPDKDAVTYYVGVNSKTSKSSTVDFKEFVPNMDRQYSYSILSRDTIMPSYTPVVLCFKAIYNGTESRSLVGSDNANLLLTEPGSADLTYGPATHSLYIQKEPKTYADPLVVVDPDSVGSGAIKTVPVGSEGYAMMLLFCDTGYNHHKFFNTYDHSDSAGCVNKYNSFSINKDTFIMMEGTEASTTPPANYADKATYPNAIMYFETVSDSLSGSVTKIYFNRKGTVRFYLNKNDGRCTTRPFHRLQVV